MAPFRGIQEYIALDANNIARVEDEGNIISISGNIVLHPPQGHPILYNGGVFYSDMSQFNSRSLHKWKPPISKHALIEIVNTIKVHKPA